MRLQLKLNEPLTGSLKLRRNSDDFADVSIGKLIRVSYRGAVRGAFFVENISDNEVSATGENTWATIRGRGGLAILDEAVVWYSAQNETKRTFTSTAACSMLIDLIDEAQARGCFPNLTYSFSATEDTDGNSWTDSKTLSMRVGTSLLDVARKIAGMGIDLTMDFNWEVQQYTLNAYRDGAGSDLSGSVIFRPGFNCTNVTSETAGESIKNAFLIEYGQGNFASVTDASSISSYRRRESSLSMGQVENDTDAEAVGQNELDETKDPKSVIRVEVDDNVGPKVFVDYDVGDWVTYVDRDHSSTAYRVRGIALDWQEDDRFATVQVALSSIRQELEIQNAQAISKLGGSLSSSRATPANDVVTSINEHNNDPNAHPNRDEFIELEDTPDSYTGESEKILAVKATEDGVEFVTAPSEEGSGISLDTTDFDNILSASEDTVQKAVDVLDDHKHDSEYVNEADHDKDAHDALGINADTVDGEHASAFENAGAVATHESDGDLHLSSDQNDALDGSNSPSASNVMATEDDLADERAASALNRVYSFLYGTMERAINWLELQTFLGGIDVTGDVTVNQTEANDIADFRDAGVSVVKIMDGGGVLLVAQAGGYTDATTGVIGYDSTKKALVFNHEGHDEAVPFDPRYGYGNFQYQISY